MKTLLESKTDRLQLQYHLILEADASVDKFQRFLS